MQIVPADTQKRWLKLALWWFHRKFSKSENGQYVVDDMENCGNPLFYKIYKIMMNDIYDNIAEEEKHQRLAVKDVGTFLLWILYKDTAYREPAVYALKKILDKKDELLPLIEEYYEEPENWYVNRWNKAKKDTKRLRAKGEISESELAPSETYFVPKLQQDRFQAINKEIDKERRKRGYDA